MHDLGARLKESLARIRTNDPELAKELSKIRGRKPTRARAESLAAQLGDTSLLARRLAKESIVHERGRPALQVSHDEPVLVFDDLESEVWRYRLERARPQVVNAIRAVGRIEVKGHLDLPDNAPVGTGWLVRPDVVVTNRHVARVFAEKGANGGFVFSRNVGHELMGAQVDFLEEAGRAADRTFAITGILHIEDRDGPDLAFLRVEGGNRLAAPLELSAEFPAQATNVAAIGYPGHDSAIPDQDRVKAIFKGVFDKKRLAPGQITGTHGGNLLHDCSTLNANSGSLLVSLDTGKAVGLHFRGTYLRHNMAVPARTVAEKLHRLR